MNRTALRKSILPGLAMPLLVLSDAVLAEISGNLGIANTYFSRGRDYAGGAAQVFGGAQYDHSNGLYAGVWTSSSGFPPIGQADINNNVAVSSGIEYDLYAGYGTTIGGVSLDVSFWDYNYPGFTDYDLEEVLVDIGVAGVHLTSYFGVGDIGHGDTATNNNTNYYSVSWRHEKFSAKVGFGDYENDASDYTHLDLGYAVTDQLSLTVSKIVDERVTGTYNDDATLILKYAFAL